MSPLKEQVTSEKDPLKKPPSKAQMNNIKIQIGLGYYICWVQGYIIVFLVSFHRFFGPNFLKEAHLSLLEMVSGQPHLCAVQ